MLQVTWVVCTENLELQGLEMALDEYEMLCWWLLLMGAGESSPVANPAWKVCVIWFKGLEIIIFEWKLANCIVRNKWGRNWSSNFCQLVKVHKEHLKCHINLRTWTITDKHYGVYV